MSGARNQVPILIAGALVLSALIGLAAAALPPEAVIASLTLGAGTLVLLLLRRASPGPSPAAEGGPAGADGSPASLGLRGSRALFYLGVLTVTQSAWRPVLGLTISELFFLAAFAGALFAVVRGRRVASVPAGLVAAVGVFTFGGVISSVGAQSPSTSGTEILQAVYVMLLWVWTAAMVLTDRRQIFIALSLWTASAAANGFGAITQAAGIDFLTGGLNSSGRATAFTQHPNDLGGAAAIALVPALLLATRWSVRERQLMRALRWLIVALTTGAIVLSGSVAGVFAGLVALVVWLSSPAVRTPLRAGIVGGLAACLIVVVALAAGRVASPADRIDEVLGQGAREGSVDSRTKQVEGAWPRIAENPIVGTGLGKFDNRVSIIGRFGRFESTQPHGLVVAAWYASGLFGLLGILAVFGVHARAGWRAFAAARSPEDLVVLWALLAAVAAFFVYANSAPLFFHQFGWIAGVMLTSWATLLVPRPVTLAGRAPAPGSVRTARAEPPLRWQPAGPGPT